MLAACLIESPVTHDQEGFLIGAGMLLLFSLICYFAWTSDDKAQRRLSWMRRFR
jgi:hypothetical protein